MLNPAVTPELEQVILRALEKDPARRYGDADEFAAALEHAAVSMGDAAAAPLPPSVGPVTGSYATATGSFGPPSESYAYPPQPLEPLVEEEGSNRRWWIALLVGLLVAAAVVGALLLFGGKQVTVPSVVGAQQAEAEAALRNKGFDTDAIQRADAQEEGSVIGQDPPGSSQADEGSTVTLTVSSGPGQATVPADLVGLGRRAARKKVTDAGFRAKETERASADVAKDKVIESSPDGGQRLDKGEEVTLIISTGPADATVPDVLRQSREEATGTLEDAGFEVTVKTTERDDVDPGTVVRQDPAGDQERPQGSTVTITVAEQSSEVSVPDVTGRSQADATRTLSGAGFQVNPQTRDTSSESEDGQVLSQSPSSGMAGTRLVGDHHGRAAPRDPDRSRRRDHGDDGAMRVAVLGGGRSSEHDVSLASAAAVRAGLAEAGHEVVEVVLEREGTWRSGGEELALRPGRGLLDCDVAFPVLHGPFGEDGTVQGLLELLGVPYVGAGVLASAACMDKVVFKDLMAQAGMAQVEYRLALAGQPVPDVGALGLPLWVKPARLGSSVGIVKVRALDELEAALAEAFSHDPRVIIEASAPEGALEVECSVLGPTDAPRVSGPGEICIEGDWYDYAAKYTPGGMQLQVPARISEGAAAELAGLAARAFTAAGCSGLARADFFVAGDEVLLNELNTMPGQTATSVYGVLWRHSGLAYPALMDELCSIALARARAEGAHRF